MQKALTKVDKAELKSVSDNGIFEAGAYKNGATAVRKETFVLMRESTCCEYLLLM
jgi:hypothetical protein